MQETFENIIEKLEKQIRIEENIAKKESDGHPITHQYAANCMKVIEKSVKQEAEQYNNGWIPCSSGKLPDEGDEFYPMCFVTLDNGAVCLGVYRYDDKQWYTKMIKDETLYTTKRNVIAWQPLPEPYQTKGE